MAHRITVPKDVHALISAMWGDVPAHGKWDFAGVMKVKDLEMRDYPGPPHCPGGPGVIIA